MLPPTFHDQPRNQHTLLPYIFGFNDSHAAIAASVEKRVEDRKRLILCLTFVSALIIEGSTEGAWRKGVSQNRLYEVSASKIPSTKFYEGFWDFVAVSFPTGPPFHETSTNSPGFHE